jgi:hypothetical protein
LVLVLEELLSMLKLEMMNIIIPTRELLFQVTTHGFINSHMKLCHQLMDTEVLVQVQKLDGTYLTRHQMSQHTIHLDLILKVHHT